MNKSRFQDILTRLKIEAEAYNANLCTFKSNLSSYQYSVEEFKESLQQTEEKFQSLISSQYKQEAVIKTMVPARLKSVA